MSKLDSLFPEPPETTGYWRSVYLEPIVGSGEKMAIAAIAVSENSFKVIQSVRSELLDCLYGNQAENIGSMITWVINSLKKELKNSGNLHNWQSPIGGVHISDETLARGSNIDDILRQAIRFSASLSSLSLDAERSDDDEQPKRYAEHWSRSISTAMKEVNPQLLSSFGKRVQLGETNVLTSFGFIHGEYTANFGLLVPSRLSASLNNVKAKLLDLETFKKSSLGVKPSSFEVIIGSPSLQDPTLTDKSIKKIRDNFTVIEEIAHAEGISVYRAESAEEAASYIDRKVA